MRSPSPCHHSFSARHSLCAACAPPTAPPCPCSSLLQVLRHCCRASPQLCQASAVSRMTEALLAAALPAPQHPTPPHAALALLTLSTLIAGALSPSAGATAASAARGAAGAAPGTAAQVALAPSAATDDALKRLAALLSPSQVRLRV